MYRASSHLAFAGSHLLDVHALQKGLLALSLGTALGCFGTLVSPLAALASPGVEFDVARAVECRDITPKERMSLYPTQRLIEVALPISVRFYEATADDVDEIDIEVSGAAAGFRVQDFAPATQMASEITHEIETTTTSKKSRSLDGTLGGSIPIPGADTVARITPSISAGLAGCNTATEKINRLPPKHVFVVSGTYAEGSGVFFKLKRNSQTSLEGVHELAVTFVTPRTWPAIALQVECSAHGERKMLWVKQSATLGHVERYVQLIPAAPAPIHQVVLKPTDNEVTPDKDKGTSVADSSAASPTKWRPPRATPAPSATPAIAAPVTKSSDKSDSAVVVKKAAADASLDAKDAKIKAAETTVSD
jgi:hypothetical protein